MKHTQGEWRVVSRGDDRVHDDIMSGQKRVASIGQSTIGDRDEAQANALLISAAPELLAACELALESLRPGAIDDDVIYHEEPYSDLQIAIAKAKGRKVEIR